MAAAKAAKKQSTAVARPRSTAVVSLKEAVQQELASLASRTGAPGGDVIRVTQDKHFALPDGVKVPGPLRVVIVDFVTARYFYDRPFDKDQVSPPACFAVSVQPTGMAPPKDVPVRQSDSCSTCPMNEFGSSGNGKACRESRDIAVIPEDADANTEIAILRASPTALKAFDSYVRSLAASMQKAPFQVVTEVSFDKNLEYASLRFGNPEPASDDLVATALALREGARSRLQAVPDFSQYTPPPKQGRQPARAARR